MEIIETLRRLSEAAGVGGLTEAADAAEVVE